jgi:hypothetical protein
MTFVTLSLSKGAARTGFWLDKKRLPALAKTQLHALDFLDVRGISRALAAGRDCARRENCGR